MVSKEVVSVKLFRLAERGKGPRLSPINHTIYRIVECVYGVDQCLEEMYI